MTMVAERETFTQSKPEPDLRSRLHAQATEHVARRGEKRCLHCKRTIPAECVKVTPWTDNRNFPQTATVLIFCPACDGAFEADFDTRDGEPRQVSITRLILVNDETRALKAAHARAHGDVLVERIAGAMDAEHEAQDQTDRRELAEAIARTKLDLAQLEASYAERFPGEAVVIADPPFRGLLDHSPYIPDAAAGQSLGGVPSPERTIDTSTSQVEAPGGGDDGPVETWDHERFDGMS